MSDFDFRFFSDISPVIVQIMLIVYDFQDDDRHLKRKRDEDEGSKASTSDRKYRHKS